MNTVLMVLGAYLIGSVSFAVVMSKVFGLADPRTYGSKNPGATNVLRSGNKAAAVMTLLVYRHSQNITNLLAGKESRIGGKSKGAVKEEAGAGHGHGKKK